LVFIVIKREKKRLWTFSFCMHIYMGFVRCFEI